MSIAFHVSAPSGDRRAGGMILLTSRDFAPARVLDGDIASVELDEF
ncbi:hypothetical protein CDS [Bradyrhizobium sp.]|nr:hypothetical protein CDS [Bradyrhizobium sp.]